jgi:hypothetical protein
MKPRIEAFFVAAIIIICIIFIVFAATKANAAVITRKDIVFNAKLRGISEQEVIKDLYDQYTVVCPKSLRRDRIQIIIPQADVQDIAKAYNIDINDADNFIVNKLHCKNWNNTEKNNDNN